MPINVTFDAPPTPPSSGDKTNFRLRYDAFLAYIQSLGAKLITFVTQINDLESNVNAKEVSATAAAASAASSANFKGTFVQGTSSALQGESWLWNTVIYRALANTTNSPTASPASWVATTYKECTLQTAIASAATTSIGTTAAGDTVHITGTTTITSFGTSTSVNGLLRIVVFDGALTLTHNATSLILPTGANITTAAGDSAEFVCENTALGYWRCTGYQRKDGTPLAVLNGVTQAASDNSTKLATTAWAKLGFISSLGANGYIKFPDWLGGLILQWAYGANTGSIGPQGNVTVNITLPVAFPNACLKAISGSDGVNSIKTSINSTSTTAIGVSCVSTFGTYSTNPLIFAIGY